MPVGMRIMGLRYRAEQDDEDEPEGVIGRQKGA
jgi:hypothetical protein